MLYKNTIIDYEYIDDNGEVQYTTINVVNDVTKDRGIVECENSNYGFSISCAIDEDLLINPSNCKIVRIYGIDGLKSKKIINGLLSGRAVSSKDVAHYYDEAILKVVGRENTYDNKSVDSVIPLSKGVVAEISFVNFDFDMTFNLETIEAWNYRHLLNNIKYCIQKCNNDRWTNEYYEQYAQWNLLDLSVDDMKVNKINLSILLAEAEEAGFDVGKIVNYLNKYGIDAKKMIYDNPLTYEENIDLLVKFFEDNEEYYF